MTLGGVEAGTAVAVQSSGVAVMLGFKRTCSTFGKPSSLDSVCDDRDAWVLALAEDGGELWSNTYAHPGNDKPSDIDARDTDDHLAMAGWSATGTWLLVTDPAGAVLWKAQYSGRVTRGVAFAPDGTIALAGEDGKQKWLGVVAEGGKLLWEKTYGVGGLGGVVALDDGFGLAGFADKQASILRTGPAGQTECAIPW